MGIAPDSSPPLRPKGKRRKKGTQLFFTRPKKSCVPFFLRLGAVFGRAGGHKKGRYPIGCRPSFVRIKKSNELVRLKCLRKNRGKLALRAHSDFVWRSYGANKTFCAIIVLCASFPCRHRFLARSAEKIKFS